MLYSIQYLRFWAAFLVLVHHVTQSLERDLGSPLVSVFHHGVTGVDLFFVISGFIMVHVTQARQPDAGDFLLRRIARVAPPYWLATLVLITVALVAPKLLASTSVDVPHIIASYLFVPWDHPMTHADMPVLHVGWTLNYEMQFYALFALALLLLPQARVQLAGAMLLLLVIAGWIFEPQNVQLRFWTAPILLEFIMGMVLAAGWHSAALANWRPAPWMGWTLLLGGMLLMVSVPMTESGISFAHGHRWLWGGVPATIVVLGALLLERAGRVVTMPSLRLLGDSSYALYIWHFFAIGVARALWPETLVGTWPGDIGFVVGVSAMAVVGGVIAYLLVEKPMVKWVSTRLLPKRKLPAAS